MNLLTIERPLVINPRLAARLGINEAIILQQLSYWIGNDHSGVYEDGRKWIYNTYADWQKQIMFLSERTIQRVVLSLEEKGIILSAMFREKKGDRTKYYTINYEHESLQANIECSDANLAPPSRQTGTSQDGAKLAPPSRQTGAFSHRLQHRLHTETSIAGGVADAPHCHQEEIFEAEVLTETNNDELTVRQEPTDKPRVEIPDDMPGPKDPKAKTFRVWANYAMAYRSRYGVWPLWNAKTAGQMSNFVDRTGKDEAPKIAAFYLTTNDSRAVSDHHSVNLLLARAESLHTQWLTGRRMNSAIARQIERTEANYEAAHAAIGEVKSDIANELDFGEDNERPFFKPN